MPAAGTSSIIRSTGVGLAAVVDGDRLGDHHLLPKMGNSFVASTATPPFGCCFATSSPPHDKQ